ncbi:MAG: hypothetical protein R3E39_21115 [Anaerolineae bacterium]
MMDLRTVVAVIITLTIAYAGMGRTLPFDTSAPVPLVAGIMLFVGYLYAARTVVRLPFALVITIRRTRYAQREYGLVGIDRLREGYVRGFMDTRRWRVGPLALVDRLTVFAATFVATLPTVGSVLLTLVGLMGLALLLIVYLLRGIFGWLVEDELGSGRVKQSMNLPFIKM